MNTPAAILNECKLRDCSAKKLRCGARPRLAGHIDFTSIFSALAGMGYTGDIGIECSALSGDPEIVLPRTAALLRDLIRESELAI